ncbi:MAG: FAD binding domain-containing protein [Planctomycetes bacterium]|nr:FAD binding domain-containing protein [Planctomycetota bacterium]
MTPRVVRARSLDDALDALDTLARAGGRTQVLAGGTDLMVEFATGRTRPESVLDIRSVVSLRAIERDDGGLRIGALATCTDLLRDPLVRSHADLLGFAAAEVGAVQIKNRATLGGNLGTASPAADLNPVLVALDATVVLRSRAARREVPAAAFLCGYRQTLLRDDELIECVRIPARPARERRAFRKVGTRRAQSISKLVVALAVTIEDGVVTRLRGAAGALAPRTILLTELAGALVGRRAGTGTLRDAVRISARSDIAPIDDLRSTAEYRREVFRRVTLTMLEELALQETP